MLNLKIGKTLKNEFKYIEDILVSYGPHFFYCINTPINQLEDNYAQVKKLPTFTSEHVSEMLLMHGLRGEWGVEVNGVKLSYDLMTNLKDMWVEAVMREYYLKYGIHTATQEKTTLKDAMNNVTAMYKLTTVSKLDRSAINTVMKSPLTRRIAETAIDTVATVGSRFGALVGGAGVVAGSMTAATATSAAAPLALTAGAGTGLVSAGTATAVGVAGATATGLIAGPAILLVGSIAAAVGMNSLLKLVNVLSVLDKTRTPNFDPSKSVYETWGTQESMVAQAANLIASHRNSPELKEFMKVEMSDLTDGDKEEIENSMAAVSAVESTGAPDNKQVSQVLSKPASEGLSELISDDVHRDDSAGKSQPAV